MIELSVLGSTELHDARGEEVAQILSQPKRLALLTYLAAAKPRGFHRREKILGLFWPSLDPKHARATLRRSLHFLRRFLGNDAITRRGSGEVGLDWDLVWCDLKAFDEALEGGRIEEAVRLYRGDLLSGLFISGAPGFEHWLDQERVATRNAAAAAMWTLANQLLEAGYLTRGEQMGHKALSLVCSDEAQVQRFVAALAEVGDRAAAVQFFERFSEGIRSTLDLEPSDDSKSLARRIRGEL